MTNFLSGFSGKNKIARRLVLYILLCSTVITLLLTVYQLQRDYRIDVESIHQRIAQINISTVPSLSEAFWVVDINSIRIKLKGMVLLPDIQYVRIKDTENTLVAEHGVSQDKKIISKSYPLNYTHRDKPVELGQIYIQASLNGVYERLMDKVVVILISQAAKTFLVSLFIFIIVQWMITRHLSSIADYASEIELHKKKDRLSLDRTPSFLTKEDELEQMVDTINSMQDKLHIAYSEIMCHKEDLEEKVLERTLELEQSTEEMASFCYTVSHDLRSPLRGIHGFSQAILEDYSEHLDDTGKDYLHRVKSASMRMSEIIDDLLGLTRVSQTELMPSVINVSELCYEALAEIKVCTDSEAIIWNIQADMQAMADRRLLKIALENLLANACKYSSKTHHARIEVGRTTVSPVNSEQDIYFVRDNGIGFDMQYKEKLFIPFQRLHGTEFEGTGIGLATVEKIITRHKGRIWAESSPDKGATFYFTLPSVKLSPVIHLTPATD